MVIRQYLLYEVSVTFSNLLFWVLNHTIIVIVHSNGHIAQIAISLKHPNNFNILEYFPAAQRRGNKYYFVASKDDCGCCSCRYAAKSSVICRTSSRQLQIRYDQQRDKLFPPTSTLNILSLLVADIMVLTLAALGALFKQFLFTGFGWSYLGCQ